MKITTKKVYCMDISPDFSVEAEQDGNVRDFWLCRKDYGAKMYMFGAVPQKGTENPATLKQELEFWADFFCDPNNNDMRTYCSELLEPGEHLEDGSFQIDVY